MTDHNHVHYETGQDNVKISIGLDVHRVVFFVSAFVVVAFVVLGIALREHGEVFFEGLRKYTTSQFDWVFMIGANFIVLFCLFLAFSPLGKIRLGGPEAKPDYSYLGWFAMLFTAGMGIGLMFFGVLEPVFHFQNPPLGVDVNDHDAARSVAMATTIFHWGLHPWSIYIVVALALSFFAYNRGLPLSIRSAFYPILGERTWGWPGHIVDILAVFCGIFGIATSLGHGAEQINAGLDYLFDISVDPTNEILIILAITSIALFSVVAGIDAGVKRLSEINMIVALLLMIAIIFMTYPLSIMKGFFASLGDYASYIVPLSNWIGREDKDLMHGWTTFYWAWWVAWSPFVGMFIARVSRGRTVRELVIYSILAPTLFCALWMSVFGGAAISQSLDGYTGVTEAVKAWSPELSLFKMLDPLPLAGILSLVSIILVAVFFVTSADSGALVIDSITAGGKIDAPLPQRVFWCVFSGLIAITLIVGGGLKALQAATITMGLPFTLVLVIMCVAIWLGLKQERKEQKA